MDKNDDKNNIIKLVPGILICFIIMLIGIYGAELIGFLMKQVGILSPESNTPISGIFVAIIVGIVVRNLIGFHKIYSTGIAFSVKYVLRTGIVLLGLRLSLVEALKLGAMGIPLIIVCIFSGIFLTLYLTKKMNQSNHLGTLIACGTGICGVTAIMTTAPVIKAKDNEISYAIANITIFGLTAMALYPFLANIFFEGDPIKTGLFLGTAIHDTSQVTGAALIYNQMFNMEEVISVATVTKLTRNLFIIVIIPIVSYLFYKNANTLSDGEEKQLPKWYKFIPVFVVYFLLFALLRTIGDITLDKTGAAFGLVQQGYWESFYTYTSTFGTTYLLGIAMAGVGLSTDFRMFKGIGIKPFYIGFIAAVTVGVVSITLISLFGHLIEYQI